MRNPSDRDDGKYKRDMAREAIVALAGAGDEYERVTWKKARVWLHEAYPDESISSGCFYSAKAMIVSERELLKGRARAKTTAPAYAGPGPDTTDQSLQPLQVVRQVRRLVEACGKEQLHALIDEVS